MPSECISALASIAKHHASQISKELKETNPLPLKLVQALERMSCHVGSVDQMGLLQFAFIVLLMIYGSMRLDDAKHVRPDSLMETSEGLAWCTKTERAR
eukprot:6464302-Amphidinium_carterae.2